MSRRSSFAAALIVSCAVARPVSLAAQTPTPPNAAPPPAAAKDVASAEAIIAALYDALSGTATQRGINSFQLFNDGSRWWIVSVLWEARHPEERSDEGSLSLEAVQLPRRESDPSLRSG